MGLVDRLKVILLDMNGTFMFGQDRFGPGEDFGAIYCGPIADHVVPTLLELR